MQTIVEYVLCALLLPYLLFPLIAWIWSRWRRDRQVKKLLARDLGVSYPVAHALMESYKRYERGVLSYQQWQEQINAICKQHFNELLPVALQSLPKEQES